MKLLKRYDKLELYHIKNGKKVKGGNPEMYGEWDGKMMLAENYVFLFGDCTDIAGNCTGIHGCCTGVIGNLDDCGITEETRLKECIHIDEITKNEKRTK
jgi:hypothetical protein